MSINKEYEFLKYEEDNGIGLLFLNREDKLNALSVEVMKELDAFLTDIKESKLKGLIFTGAGEKAFIAGADIASMKEMSPQEALGFSNRGQIVSEKFENLPFPAIACVNGFALGGGLEMALSCDFIYATENAVFGLPEVSLGLIPGFGGTQRLSKIIGRNKAKEIIYTGRKIKIEEALNLGLVLKSFKTKEELVLGATLTIEKASRNSPNAIRVAKESINLGADESITNGLKIERENFSDIFNSYDMKEGVTAFLEKREANFKGE